MSMWNFTKEINTDAAGANAEAGFIAGHQPFAEADSLPSKRNVIATDKGWVRRQAYTDVHGVARVKDEILVAAHPGANTSNDGGYASATNLGFPDIAIVQLVANTADGGHYLQSSTVTAYVTFNEPMFLSGDMTLSANALASGTKITLTGSENAAGVNYGANNTFVLTGTAPAEAGRFKFEAQSLALSVAATSQNPGFEAANTVLTGAVSNTVMNFAGDVLANGEFQVI